MKPDEFRQHGHELIDWIADHLEGLESLPVAPAVEPGDVRRRLPAHPPTEPEPWSAVMADIDEIIVPGIVHWQHPGFFAYFPSNTTYPSILGELLSAGLGVQGMSWVTSPACTELETLVMDWMQELLGLPERFRSDSATGGGVIQGTASDATLVAVLAARWRATGGAVNHDGDTTRLVGYVTAQSHSSVEKGLRVAGIGTDRVRVVPHDESFAMRADALATMIEAGSRGRTHSVLRVRDARHDVVDGVRPDARDRRGLWRCPDLVARRRGDERDGRAGAGAALGQRRPRARRQLLHQRPQVDGRQRRLQHVLDRRPAVPARRAEHPARVPALGRRRGGRGDRLPRLAGARSAGASAPSRCG